MMIPPDRFNALSNLAEQILVEHDMRDVQPVEPERLAASCRVSVVKKALPDGMSGALLKVGDSFVIAASNAIANEGFQRFTIAHELGHYFIEGHPDALFSAGDAHYSTAEFKSPDKYEREADLFAASLLMPNTPFAKGMDQAPLGLSGIESLSEAYATSLTATAIRYVCRAEYPIALVMSRGNRVLYSFLSPPLRDCPEITFLRKSEPVPRDTGTWCFNQKSENISRAVRKEYSTALPQWFGGGPDLEMDEEVIGLGSYGNTLTVVYADVDLEEFEVEDDE